MTSPVFRCQGPGLGWLLCWWHPRCVPAFQLLTRYLDYSLQANPDFSLSKYSHFVNIFNVNIVVQLLYNCVNFIQKLVS